MKTTTKAAASAVLCAGLLLLTAGAAQAAETLPAGDDVVTWDYTVGEWDCLVVDPFANDDPLITDFARASVTQGSDQITVEHAYSDAAAKYAMEVCPADNAAITPGSIFTIAYEGNANFDATGAVNVATSNTATITITVAGTAPDPTESAAPTGPAPADPAPAPDAVAPTRTSNHEPSRSIGGTAAGLALILLGIAAPYAPTAIRRIHP